MAKKNNSGEVDFESLQAELDKLDPLARIEAEYKLELIRDMQDKRKKKAEDLAELQRQQQRRIDDMKKDLLARSQRQAKCKHKKGGRNNNFAKGNSADYSININTYPDGTQIAACTRCGAERTRPTSRLKKKNPQLYADMMKAWNEWSEYTTDNSPSGSQIFLIESAA